MPATDLGSFGDAPPSVAEGTESNDVVQACRVLHAAKLSNTVWGFVALRDVADRGIWVTTGDLGFEEISVADCVLVAFSEEILVGRGEPNEEFALALAVMTSRPDVNALVHSHSLHATAFAATQRPLEAISHEGCHLVPPDVVRKPVLRGAASGDEGVAFAAILGERNAILLAGHGLVTVGDSLGEAVALAVYLEKACQLQLLAGEDVHTVSDNAVMEKRSGQAKRPRISWEYLKRVTPPTTAPST